MNAENRSTRRGFLRAGGAVTVASALAGSAVYRVRAAEDNTSSLERPTMEFDHIGIVTTEKKEDETYVTATKVWVTNFRDHPYHVEWLRFDPDSPVTGPVREMPHVAYRVKSIAQAAEGLKVLLEPFDAGMAVVGFYQTGDGAVVEFMEYPEDNGSG